MRQRALHRMLEAPRCTRPRNEVAPDATTEPDPGPPPEAVFDRTTGPYARRSPLGRPGAAGLDGET